MKNVFVFFGIALFTLACSQQVDTTDTMNEEDVTSDVTYASFGDSISAEGAISAEDMLKAYVAMENGDTVAVKFSGVIESVCQKKGCWMNVELSEEESAYIRFKDYGFFMPFNAAESEAIVSGFAFVTKRSVDELRHDAEDADKSLEEINAITEPEVSFGFLADGVLIKQ